MTCQICGTRDNKDNREPVRVYRNEGICRFCESWYLAIIQNVAVDFKTFARIVYEC